MSKTRPAPSGRLTCADVHFVEVDFPRQLRPRLVIEFSEGLSLLLEDQATIPLAAEFIASFRKHLTAKGVKPALETMDGAWSTQGSAVRLGNS